MMSALVETRKIPRIACIHRPEDQIITESNETVCKSCGVVLGIDNAIEASTESTVNLFQEIQPGTKPVKIEATKRVHEQKFALSAFSNACSKLKMPRHASFEAWNSYSKLDKNTDFSTAEKACFALFVACRNHSVPMDEIQIQKAVKFAFSLKATINEDQENKTNVKEKKTDEKNNYMPTMLKIFSKLKITAKELGIKCDDDCENYYLNVYSNKVPPQHRDKIRKKIVGLRNLKTKYAVPSARIICRSKSNEYKTIQKNAQLAMMGQTKKHSKEIVLN